MSGFVNFVPSTVAPFSFQPTLNGTLYSAVVTWNVFGQRYYLNLYDLSGNLIIAQAMVSSPSSVQAQFSWSSNIATVTTPTNHGLPIASVANIVTSGTGTSFDGQWLALATTPTTLTYALTTNPVAAPGLYNPSTVPTPVSGFVGLYENLVATVLASPAWLIYRQDIQQLQFA